ncbi:MAG: hypothetical protein KAR07_10705, partial [Spirochaetes bacterium]|nr:hypothetical protein [Spirochaetota bacterium]
MSIGAERQMYPFHLADMNSWSEGATIVNCSLPGFTSADACAFFFRKKKSLKSLTAVIIYLGNCDAMSSELRKGKYSPSRQLLDTIRAMSGREKAKARLKNRLLHFKWNNSFNGGIEAPERLEDFEYNVSRIVSASRSMNVPVILIRPEAPILFPAGTGKGNFIFYKHLGIDDRVADRISIEDPRFKKAFLHHENLEYREAMNTYEGILLESGPISSNQEYLSVIVNNYAVCAVEMRSFEEAKYLLSLLLKERGARKEIILYNLAQISKRKGDMQEYKRLINESYEADESMYRIREPYKIVIDKISRKFKNISVIDFKNLIADADYVDHCHPLPEAQKLIAKQIAEKLQISKLKGNQSLEIENHLYNPEYSLGNTADFHSYFKTYVLFSSDEINNFISRIKIPANDNELRAHDWDAMFEDVPKTISLAFKYHIKHPCFPEIRDVIIARPTFPSDVGRFPEYFLFRYLIPYFKIVQGTPELSQLFSAQVGIFRSVEEFMSILPDSTIADIGKSDLDLDCEYERLRLPAILQKVNAMLIEHLKQGNQIYSRLKTTIFWYFRETLRFGSHSRISMRYERVPLEFMAEALAVAGVLDLNMDSKMRLEIKRLIGWVEETVQVHEYFCRQFSLEH